VLSVLGVTGAMYLRGKLRLKRPYSPVITHISGGLPAHRQQAARLIGNQSLLISLSGRVVALTRRLVSGKCLSLKCSSDNFRMAPNSQFRTVAVLDE
jgi:hypothetical protein